MALDRRWKPVLLFLLLLVLFPAIGSVPPGCGAMP
jgi:hypothetical protein